MKKVFVFLFIFSCCLFTNAQVTEEPEEAIIEGVQIEEKSDELTDVPFAVIDEVPIFPGCSGTRQEKKNCLNKAIQMHVAKNFNYKTNDSLITGKQKIYVQFTIGKDGIVKNIKSRAPHPSLELEGKRVIELLPKMKPGKQRGRNVNVNYMLPIVFNVE